MFIKLNDVCKSIVAVDKITVIRTYDGADENRFYISVYFYSKLFEFRYERKEERDKDYNIFLNLISTKNTNIENELFL